jgi:hypothetical protein
LYIFEKQAFFHQYAIELFSQRTAKKGLQTGKAKILKSDPATPR